jgi:hypothetical protein
VPTYFSGVEEIEEIHSSACSLTLDLPEDLSGLLETHVVLTLDPSEDLETEDLSSLLETHVVELLTLSDTQQATVRMRCSLCADVFGIQQMATCVLVGLTSSLGINELVKISTALQIFVATQQMAMTLSPRNSASPPL